ncbi:MAG: acyltransferase [Solirubrobacterales bacterium]|nr:acyltransferase [Solirubrobacterales bacterium]HMT03936.1 acyltransferase [Solirubrobacterales bacterium]
MSDQRGWKMWWQKRRWYERGHRPLSRLMLDREISRRGSYIRHPIEGDVLGALRSGQLSVGQGCHFEPGCWITMSDHAKVTLGDDVWLNRNVMVAAEQEVMVGDHVMFANGCFVGDASHRFNDPNIPITWQGFTSKGPVRIGSNVWLGVNVVVTSGVTIGDHCVVGANSVVTGDLPEGTIAAGAPAKVIRSVEFLPE